MLLDLAHRVRRFVLRVTGWRTRGVRVMVFDRDGQVLLIRHGYADREAWWLPGGALGRREAPATAARREVREEVGCALVRLEDAGVFVSTAEGWRDTVYLFRADTDDVSRVDGREVVEARFFALDALPPTTTPATLRRIAELGGAPRAGQW